MLKKAFQAAEQGRLDDLLGEIAIHGELLAFHDDERNDETLLHVATCARQMTIVEQLVQLHTAACVSVDAHNRFGMTPLHYAAIQGSTELIGILLAGGSQALNRQDFSGETPLHYAARYGDFAAVEALLSAGGHSCITKSGLTPLHIAAGRGHLAIMHALLQAFPEAVLARDQIGEPPLHSAARMGHSEAIEALVSAAPRAIAMVGQVEWTILHCAASSGKQCAVEAVIRREPRLLNFPDSFGQNALHLVGCQGDVLLTDCLLMLGATVPAPTRTRLWPDSTQQRLALDFDSDQVLTIRQRVFFTRRLHERLLQALDQ